MIRTTSSWTLGPSGDRFQRDGDDAFFLADTVWAALASPSDDEWDAYLTARLALGFDAVLVSMLPIPHDRSVGGQVPFEAIDGKWDVGRLDHAFFRRARDRIVHSTERGLVVVPVLLWNGYLPGTWGERVTPGLVMSPEQRDRYLDVALETLSPNLTFVLISGDDNLDSEQAIAAYISAAGRVRAAAPHALIGMHTGPTARYSPELAAEDWDFYAYQSGHVADWSRAPRELSAHHLGHRIRRPILNLEPPYEQHARVDGEGRHSAFDVRGASWTSVLSGAAAGLGYGAQGVWSWHRDGDAFTGEAFSGMPEAFDRGLDYPGAQDAALVKTLVDRHALFSLRERPGIVVDGPERSIAGAALDDSVAAVYVPEPGPVRLALPAHLGTVITYDLARRIVVRADVRRMGATITEISTASLFGDALHVLQ